MQPSTHIVSGRHHFHGRKKADVVQEVAEIESSRAAKNSPRQFGHFKAPKGQNSIAQGNALGLNQNETTSPERAQPKRFAPSGLRSFLNLFPRALPWAVEFRPVGAQRASAYGLPNGQTLRGVSRGRTPF